MLVRHPFGEWYSQQKIQWYSNDTVKKEVGNAVSQHYVFLHTMFWKKKRENIRDIVIRASQRKSGIWTGIHTFCTNQGFRDMFNCTSRRVVIDILITYGLM